jgi:hypothetical protein
MKKYTIERQSSAGVLTYHSALHVENRGHAEFTPEFRMASAMPRDVALAVCAGMNADLPPDVWAFRVVENTN